MQRTWLRTLPMTLLLAAACGNDGDGGANDTDDEASSSSGDVDPSATTMSTTTAPTTTGMATTSATTTATTDDTTGTDPDTGDTTTGEPSTCGDGMVDEGEQCDDANDVDGDGCNVDCVASGATIWELVHDVDGLNASARGVAIANDGSVVFVGEIEESANGPYDILAVGIDAEGGMRWEYRYDSAAAMEDAGGSTDRAYAVAVDDDGAAYVSGHELFLLEDDDFVEHVTITKLDGEGQEVWRHGGEATSRGRGYGVGVGPDDEVFLVGTHGTTSFVSKYNANGLHFWTQDRSGTGGCNGCDHLWGVRPTADGGVVVSGTVDNDDSDLYIARFDAAGDEMWTISEDVVGDQNGSSALPVGDGTLVKVDTESTSELRRYDADGELEWTLDGVAPVDGVVYDVAADAEGGFAVLSNGYVDESSVTTIDRYDAGGALLWSREIATPFTEGGQELRALDVGPDGRIALAGWRATEKGTLDAWALVLAP